MNEPKHRTDAPEAWVLFPLVLFGLLVLTFTVLRLVTPERTMSDTENRMLRQRPELSVQSFLDGGFTEGLTGWFGDQFPGRDRWISLNLLGQELVGRHEAGGVYLGEDGYLLSLPESADPERLEAKLTAIRDFAAARPEIPVTAAVAPPPAVILADRLPADAPMTCGPDDVRTLGAALEGAVRFPDLTGALAAHGEEYIFYRTDHHWTSLGAYYALEALAGDLGVTELCPYSFYPVTADFEGTLASRTGRRGTEDTIDICVPETDIEYYVNYLDSGEKSRSPYQSQRLTEKDKYTVFFGGNHPRMDIATTNNNDRILLVLKDSYANSLLPLLTPYFEKIIVIDPRYYYDDPAMLLTGEGVTDVLLLYSWDTFMTDTALTDVLTAAEVVGY